MPPTLNRFPLLGLWAREAARRLGYTRAEADSLGHAYAVLYAIRARGETHKKTKHKAKPAEAPAAEGPTAEQLEFCGDRLDVSRDEDGHVHPRVGGEEQTPRGYHVSVQAKFPPGYYDKLEEAFRDVFKAHKPSELKGHRLVYNLYDQWKKSCAVGRSVDLDKLLDWCRQHSKTTT
jgi:hypothetical protein